MSFILDALRKSENERRLEAAPDILHSAHAVRRDRIPTWAVFTLGGLTAAVLALSAYAILDRSNAPQPTRATAQPANETERPGPPPAAVESPLSDGAAARVPASAFSAETSQAPVAGDADPETAGVGSSLAEPADPTAGTIESSAPAPRSAATNAMPTGGQEADIAGLPSYAAAVADGLGLSNLQMQLLVHSAVPANRFVVINGKRYREGETLTEGPRVDAVAADGAALSYRGRRFLLTPN